jgi:prepilin-type N-terminal cleavage/methylation domain-containing protein
MIKHQPARGCAATRATAAFTLIELLVVIAIISILMAAIRPSITAANDKANTATCQSRLAQVDLAIRQYVEDHGRMPPDLDELLRGRYLLDSDLLRCSKTGAEFHYHAVSPDGAGEQVIASCVPPAVPRGKRPHGRGEAYVFLRLSGKTGTAR